MRFFLLSLLLLSVGSVVSAQCTLVFAPGSSGQLAYDLDSMFRVVTTETPLGSRQRGTLSCSSEATAFIDVVNLELSENFSPTFDQVSVVGWSDTGARLLSYTLYPDGRSEQQQNPQLVSAGQSIDVSFALTFTNRDTIPSGDYNIRLELDVTPNSGGLTLLPPVPPLE